MSTDPYSGQPNQGAPQPGSPPKSNKKLIIVIVGVVLVLGVVPCLGIIAAITVPAFMRYTKKSKVSEAQVTLARMASEVKAHAIATCQFPEELPRHADLESCSSGAKCLPVGELPEFWAKAGDLTQPKYFVYSATMEEGGMVLRAEADFNSASPAVHTNEVRLTINDCAVESGPFDVVNEFE